jgi:hypothetical protein
LRVINNLRGDRKNFEKLEKMPGKSELEKGIEVRQGVRQE